MTAVMSRLHRRLDDNKRYPLPPREIVQATVPTLGGNPAIDATLAAHFAYGALSGAALASIAPRPSVRSGITGGVGIWLASYLGWIPAAGILKPATLHPAERNSLMILAHAAWGAAFAVTQRELLAGRRAMAEGPIKYRPGSPPSALSCDSEASASACC